MKVEQRHHGEKAASATRVFCTAFCMFVKGLVDTPFPKSCLHGAPFPKSCLHGASGNLFVLRVVFLAHVLAKPVSLAAFLFGLQQVGAWPSHWQDPRQGWPMMW